MAKDTPSLVMKFSAAVFPFMSVVETFTTAEERKQWAEQFRSAMEPGFTSLGLKICKLVCWKNVEGVEVFYTVHLWTEPIGPLKSMPFRFSFN